MKKRRTAFDRIVHMETACIQSGERGTLQGVPVFPIWQTATFTFRDFAEIEQFNTGASSKIKYGRYGNPLQKVCEAKLAALEGSEGCLLFASGMNAITTAILALTSAGDHVIYSSSLYRNSTRFFAEVLPRLGVATTCVQVDSTHNLKEALQRNTKVVFYEVPTNLFLRVADLRTIIKICKTPRQRPLVVIDSTFATPLFLRPLAYGADLVVHSLTKYLAGHDDLLAGCVCGSHELLSRICIHRDVLGGICDPHNTFLCIRSLKTFVVRMERLNETGGRVAEFLGTHPKVKRVWYPGLASHPDYRVAKDLLRGFGSVIYFEVKGGVQATRRFIERLRLPLIGTNFGGVHTFIEPFSQLTFGKLTKTQRAHLGVGENLIRLCVGLENSADVIEDLRQALCCLR